MLERDFSNEDIQAQVAKALSSPDHVDLAAHQLLLDLAKGPDGRVRLVTTNFDRLFEKCDSTIRFWSPPRLPELRRFDELDGIVHLHGVVNPKYSGAEGDFVLSAAEFGRAYLSEAWATEFIQALLDRYLVVFVGYTADDPPVHYLLEALHRSAKTANSLFAFQSGSDGEAEAKWSHKGVEPIAYDSSDSHRVLWETLGAWATRARDVEAWHQGVIDLARRGPERLQPHERGQVAHLARTLDGLKRFSSAEPPPPADWLCVFDPAVRYADPRREYGQENTFVDPFIVYGLDDDATPSPKDPADHYSKRAIPPGAWDGFTLTRLDRADLGDNNLPAFRGFNSTNIPRLPDRLANLAIWMRKVANQPAAIWWSAGQSGVHPVVQNLIQHRSLDKGAPASDQARKAWRYIFEAWANAAYDIDNQWFYLESSIKSDGWTGSNLRALASILRPRIEVARPYGSPRPPGPGAEIRYSNMVHVDVKYFEPHSEFSPPAQHLPYVVTELRRNLELAIALERELTEYEISDLAPIEPDSANPGEPPTRSFGIAIPISIYVKQFKALTAANADAARSEALNWRVGEHTIFARLKIWACQDERLFSADAVAETILNLSDKHFWDLGNQRDLLLMLKRRWNGFDSVRQSNIEQRIIDGPRPKQGDEDKPSPESRATIALERIYWLSQHGCVLTRDIEKVAGDLKQRGANWNPANAIKAAESLEARSGMVRTETEYSSLLAVPLKDVVATAIQHTGRNYEAFVHFDPFLGLATEKPARALTALTLAQKQGEFPLALWQAFLSPQAREKDPPRLVKQVAHRLLRLPPEHFGTLTYYAPDWLQAKCKLLWAKFPMEFVAVYKKIVNCILANPSWAKSAIEWKKKERDWVTDAINSPAGKIAQALFHQPELSSLAASSKFPASWLDLVERLLALEGDARLHSLVILAYRVSWLYHIDSGWTERQLLSAAEAGTDESRAFWAGFLWGVGSLAPPSESMYRRLKRPLLELVVNPSEGRRSSSEILSAILLRGWAPPDAGHGVFTDVDVRQALVGASDGLRGTVLWQVKNWSKHPLWAPHVKRFLTDVWPRQKAAKSARVTTQLCELAFSNVKLFGDIVDVVLSLATRVDGNHLFLPGLLTDGILEAYPEKALILLHTILPESPHQWPMHMMDEAFARIEAAEPALAKDARLVELKHRWAAR